MNPVAIVDILALLLFSWFLIRLMLGLTPALSGIGGLLAIGPALLDRYIGSLTPPAAAGSTYLDLPRDFLYGGLRLRVSGALQVSGGTTNGTLHDDNPFSYIRRLIVEGTGGGQSLQLKNMRGIHFARVEHLLTGQEPNAAPIVSAGVGGPTNWSAVISAYFIMPHPKAQPEVAYRSVLNPREFSRLSLEVQSGDATDFINGGDRTVALTLQKVDVYALQAVNLQLVQSPLRYIETQLLRDSTTAIATERRPSNALPVGRPYRYLYLRTTNEAANVRQPVDDTLAAQKLFISQTLVYRYNDFREYAQQARVDHDVLIATNPAGLNPLGSRDNPVIGSYMFDFMREGRLDGLLDASRFPARGVPIDLLQDIATASARQIDFCAGFVVPSPMSIAGPRAAQPARRRAITS